MGGSDRPCTPSYGPGHTGRHRCEIETDPWPFHRKEGGIQLWHRFHSLKASSGLAHGHFRKIAWASEQGHRTDQAIRQREVRSSTSNGQKTGFRGIHQDCTDNFSRDGTHRGSGFLHISYLRIHSRFHGLVIWRLASSGLLRVDILKKRYTL